VVGKKRDRDAEDFDAPVDLASRIGDHGRSRPQVAAEIVRRVDGPIESDRSARVRPTLIGADEAPASRPQMALPERPRALPAARPMMIGLEEVAAKLVPVAPAAAVTSVAAEERAALEGAAAGPAIVTPREAPLLGEMDLVVTPLPTPDDWHHFELALRRVPGVGPLRVEYYRAGILKLRLQWTGTPRFAEAVANVPGYRVGILGEDRSTVQIRVARNG